MVVKTLDGMCSENYKKNGKLKTVVINILF